jgi:Flp pilus assembly protein CpaB
MSRSRLFILGLVALAFGGFLAAQVYKNLQTRASATTMATTDVLVAARDIQIGTRIGEGDVKSVKFPPLTFLPASTRVRARSRAVEPSCPSRRASSFCPASWRRKTAERVFLP